MRACPFCSPPADRVLLDTPQWIVLQDAYPVSPGHALLVPKRHIASLFELSADEQAALFQVLQTAKARLDAQLGPQGYNLGVNDGTAAGQTVMHLHIHLIPRYRGDCPDPRGGVRWIFPDKARYWKA